MKKQHIVIIGATSAIAQQCLKQWLLEEPKKLTLVGRSKSTLQRVANDLLVRSPQSEIEVYKSDFQKTPSIQQTATEICSASCVDIVLIAHGSLPEQSECQSDLSVCDEAIRVNGTSCVLFAEAFCHHLQQQNYGTLAIISSVAADRGRKSNYSYGAAKGLVSIYAQGLQHRFANSAINVVLIKPGPTDTPMTANLKNQKTELANVTEVAKDIVTGISKAKPTIYTPKKWRLIMFIIRQLPQFIFNRLNI